MFDKLVRAWRRWQERRRLSRLSSPQVVRELASELAHLSRLAECAMLSGQDPSPLRRLREEMEALSAMTGKPEFLRLPPERRAAICEQLRRSQQFLIAAMQNGPPPTDRVQ